MFVHPQSFLWSRNKQYNVNYLIIHQYHVVYFEFLVVSIIESLCLVPAIKKIVNINKYKWDHTVSSIHDNNLLLNYWWYLLLLLFVIVVPPILVFVSIYLYIYIYNIKSNLFFLLMTAVLLLTKTASSTRSLDFSTRSLTTAATSSVGTVHLYIYIYMREVSSINRVALHWSHLTLILEYVHYNNILDHHQSLSKEEGNNHYNIYREREI